ncbi:hypothetical protein WICPIJ_010033 [Wickerhamomyces pijperi]|uniref:Uncharacterized protein n=1 Tax=Wickerhamomyces pijperi TaxID=599730 RepID=A0A9P8TAR1_WICPI|nr:hypothetical protein WICPIJ_010033 [Wickerhamomyces pijperi]
MLELRTVSNEESSVESIGLDLRNVNVSLSSYLTWKCWASVAYLKKTSHKKSLPKMDKSSALTIYMHSKANFLTDSMLALKPVDSKARPQLGLIGDDNDNNDKISEQAAAA